MKPAHEDRAYQAEIEEAIFDHWRDYGTNCIAAAPGGVGKSFIMARITKRVLDHPGTRTMVLAQDGKLLTQNAAELVRYWPQADVGIYSSGLKRRDTRNRVVFGGIQSIYKKAKEFGHRDIILLDECDLLSPAEETMYQRFFKEMKEMNPNLLMAGLTASPYRMKEGCLTNLEIWDRVVIDLTKTERFMWFIENRYLKPLITRSRTKENPEVIEIDVQNISMKGGDFDERELQEASNTHELNHAIVKRNIELAHDRKHWLGFVSGIEHGQDMAKVFQSYGVSAVMLSSKDAPEYIKECERKFRSGEIRVMLNFNLFIRGWDFPALDFIFWATATQSPNKWVQGNLRGTRTFTCPITGDWLENCLVADYGSNIRRLGQVNNPVLPKPRRKGDEVAGEAPVRECPECFSVVPIQAKQCPDCGFVFPPPQSITKKASTDAIMVGTEPQIEQFNVRGIRYQPKLSKKGSPMLQVTYNVGTHSYKNYFFFASENSWLLGKAESWWLQCGGHEPVPENETEAADRAGKELRIPSTLKVDVNKKYPDIKELGFE